MARNSDLKGFNTCKTPIPGNFPQKRNSGAAARKEGESNRDIERKYIQTGIHSYTVALFSHQPEQFWICIANIYTPHFFVKMTSHGFDADCKSMYAICLSVKRKVPGH